MLKELVLEEVENILNGEIVVPAEHADSKQMYIVAMERDGQTGTTC